MIHDEVVLLRTVPGGTDQYGDPIPGSTERVPLTGAVVAPRMSAAEGEFHDYARNTVIVGYTLYAPLGVDITPSDQVEIAGQVFDVEGEPGPWVSPFSTWAPGQQVALRRAEG